MAHFSQPLVMAGWGVCTWPEPDRQYARNESHRVIGCAPTGQSWPFSGFSHAVVDMSKRSRPLDYGVAPRRCTCLSGDNNRTRRERRSLYVMTRAVMTQTHHVEKREAALEERRARWGWDELPARPAWVARPMM